MQTRSIGISATDAEVVNSHKITDNITYRNSKKSIFNND